MAGALSRYRMIMLQLRCPSPVIVRDILMRLSVLFCLVSTSSALDISIIKSSQNLPQKCTEQFVTVVRECPSRHLPDDKLYWNQLSTACCQEYPGTTLHCQQSSTNIFPACLPRIRVAKGYYAEIVTNSSGYPELKTFLCDRDYYENTDRQSDDLPYNYCTKPKAGCSGEGQQLLCRGGPAEDDRCVCREGYRPDPDDNLCREGLFQDGGCRCVPEPCPEGKTRNISQTHDDVSCDAATEPDYSCYAGVVRKSTSTTATVPLTSSTRRQDPATTSQPGSGSDDDRDTRADWKESNDRVFPWTLLAGVAISLAILLAAGVILWCLCKQRIRRVIDAVKTRMHRTAPPGQPAAGADYSFLPGRDNTAAQSRNDDSESLV